MNKVTLSKHINFNVLYFHTNQQLKEIKHSVIFLMSTSKHFNTFMKNWLFFIVQWGKPMSPNEMQPLTGSLFTPR